MPFLVGSEIKPVLLSDVVPSGVHVSHPQFINLGAALVPKSMNLGCKTCIVAMWLGY